MGIQGTGIMVTYVIHMYLLHVTLRCGNIGHYADIILHVTGGNEGIRRYADIIFLIVHMTLGY